MIVAAAIIYDGVVWTLPRPARHHHIIKAHFEVTQKTGSGKQGFVDEEGIFHDRHEAMAMAIICEQPVRVHPESRPLSRERQLFSEDLW